MKAVLVFDIDEDIFKDIEEMGDLDIFLEWDHDVMIVPKTKCIKNCTLKPLPEKDPYKDPSEDYEYGYNRAWNTCLEEITGDE